MTYAPFVSKKILAGGGVAAGTFCAGTGQSAAGYVQTNLVSDMRVWRPSPILH